MSEQSRHEEFKELLGAYALNALEPGERAALEQHLTACSSCQLEVTRHEETMAALTPSVPPPEGVWARIEADIQADRQREAPAVPDQDAIPPTDVTPIAAARSHRWLGGLAGAAAAVAVAVALTRIVSGEDGPGTPTFEAQVVAASNDTPVSGQVRLFEPDAPGGRLVIELTDLPPSPSGHHYQVWVLRADGGGAMEAVGSFSPDSETTVLELPLPGPGDYAALDISVQEDGGSPEHSGISVAGATLS